MMAMDEKIKNKLCAVVVGIAALAIIWIVFPSEFAQIVNIIVSRLPHTYTEIGRDLFPIAIGVVIYYWWKSKSITNVSYYNQGIDFSESGDYNKALDAYNNAIKHDPKNASALNNKSYVLTQLGRYDEAIDAAEKALEISPYDKDIHATLKDAQKKKNKK